MRVGQLQHAASNGVPDALADELRARLPGGLAKGTCSVLELRLPAGARGPRQRLSGTTGLVVLSGELEIALTRGSWHLTRSQWALVPAGTTYGLRNPGAGAARLLEILWPEGR